MRRFRSLLFILFLSVIFGFRCPFCFAQLEGFEFVDADVRDVFYTLSMFYGKPIVGDDTVSGKVTFRFAGNDFEEAFDSFLRAERFFVEKTESKWIVSRVHFSSGDDGEIELEALDVKPSRLLEKISGRFGAEVSYDVLPDSAMSLHAKGKCARDFVDAFVRQLGKGYEVSVLGTDGAVLRVERVAAQTSSRTEVTTAKMNVSRSGEKFSVDVTDCQVSNVIEKLFALEKKEFMFASDAGSRLRRISFKDKSFEEALSLVCAGASLGWVYDGSMYYILSGNAVSGNGLSFGDDVSFGGGSLQTMLDSGKVWKKYELNYISVEEALRVVESVLGKVVSVRLLDGKEFMVLESEGVHQKIEELISSIDMRKDFYMVELKYITVQEFLSHLPPGINSSLLKQTGRDNCLFFTGTAEEFGILCKALPEIDVPVKRVSYDLLVIQYTYTGEETWESSLASGTVSGGEATSFTGVLGSVLSLNLDVLTTFGYRFACNLQTALNENRAHVFADTTLHGVSGGKINFQNTNTYRYRDNNLDPETGAPVYSGVTREISSGLKIEVNGWVSGDGMITSHITASISRQGNDTSSSTGNPPPTSEKLITTEVRGKSGEPIVLSGLVQNESSQDESGVPWFCRIPVIGKMFSMFSKQNENTEMVIYLVPHWIRDVGSGGTASDDCTVLQFENDRECNLDLDEEWCRKMLDFVEE